jgi:hypothetical protein
MKFLHEKLDVCHIQGLNLGSITATHGNIKDIIVDLVTSYAQAVSGVR